MNDKPTSLTETGRPDRPSLSEEDIIEGMKAIDGYIDLTPHDFKTLYEKVYEMARKRILSEYSAKDIMKSPALAIGMDSSLEELVMLLSEHGYSGLPVTDSQGMLAGVVSSKDVLTALGFPPTAHSMLLVAESLKQPLDLGPKIEGKTVRDIMSAPPVFVTPEASMADIAMIFRQKTINRLPVADASGKLLGIITRENLINSLSRLL